MRRLPFARHLSVSKLRYRYKACRHPIEKVRWHALWLLARTDEPRTPDQVAALVGLSGVTVRDILHRWNGHGPEGVTDRRKTNGAAPKLAARQRQALYAALQKRPPDGGLWTGPKVARYVRDRWAIARPRTGETVTVILPRVNVNWMAEALGAFVAAVDPEGTKVLVVIVDRAGWHTAKRLAVPPNVALHFLPPCTPELQPVEPFWALVREGVANDTFDRLADLRRVIRRRCRRLARDRDTVLGAIGFRWAINLET